MMVKSGDILWREDDEPNTCWIVENADEKFFVAAKYRPRDEKSLERISISRVGINREDVEPLQEQGVHRAN